MASLWGGGLTSSWGSRGRRKKYHLMGKNTPFHAHILKFGGRTDASIGKSASRITDRGDNFTSTAGGKGRFAIN